MAVYFIRHDGHIKIGKSVDPWKRLASLQTAHHDTLEMVAIMPGSEDLEAGLHRAFGEHMKRGEWFEEHPALMAFIEIVRETFPDLQRPFMPDPIEAPQKASEDVEEVRVQATPNAHASNESYKSYKDKSPLLIGESFTFRLTHKGHYRRPSATPDWMWARVTAWAYGHWEMWEEGEWRMLCAPGVRFDFVGVQHVSIMRFADGPPPNALDWGGTLRSTLEGVLNDALKEAIYNRKNNSCFLAVYNDEQYGATVAIRMPPGNEQTRLDVPEEVIDYWRQYKHPSPLPEGVSIEA